MSQADDVNAEPLKRPKKAAALTIRMTQEVRDLLDERARRDHRPVSEVAEMWLTRAAQGEADYRVRMGGSQIGEAVEALLDYARKVEERVGNPRTFLPARDALLAGWRTLLDKALPYTPDTPEGERFRIARAALRTQCQTLVLKYLDEKTSNPEAIEYLIREARYMNALYRATLTVPVVPLVQRFLDVSQKGGIDDVSALAEAIESTKADAPASITEDIAAVSSAITTFRGAYRAYMEPRLAAIAEGEAIAEGMGSIPPAAKP